MSRIFVAVRAAEEKAIPSGRWIDLDDGDAVRRQIEGVLQACHQDAAEGRSVLAYDGLPDFGPHPDVDELLAYLDAVDDYGEAFEKLWASRPAESVIRAADQFADAYQGTYPDAGAWARHYLALIGGMPKIESQFDFDAYASAAVAKGDVRFIGANDGGVHVFWSE
jgi:antirestriction protein